MRRMITGKILGSSEFGTVPVARNLDAETACLECARQVSTVQLERAFSADLLNRPRMSEFSPCFHDNLHRYNIMFTAAMPHNTIKNAPVGFDHIVGVEARAPEERIAEQTRLGTIT